MDADGTFYASKVHLPGLFHHSSLVAGAPVAAAGEIKVEDGKLVLISDRSGHYQPKLKFAFQALAEFDKQGVDVSAVTWDFIGST